MLCAVPRRRLTTAAVLLSATLAGCEGAPSSTGADGAGGSTGTALRGTVERVVDGDTLRVRTGSAGTERVRLLGIDAPEVSETRTGSAQCGGAEALADLAVRARRGTVVELETDPQQDRRDRFGRLLAYVRVPGTSGTLQEQLLADGWARVYVYDRARPFSRVEEFRAAADAARRDRVGVWDECGGDFRRPLR